MVESQDMDFAEEGAVDNVSQQTQERLIIRTGTIGIQVDNTRETREDIETIVTQYAAQGAFVVSTEEFGGEDSQPFISMRIRVPAEQFDEVMDALADLAVEVTNRSESGQDVTEEFVDLQARVESLEAARDRLLDIIAEAETTEDLLRAEEQLTQREAEIESIKGRLQFLEQSAALSNISIEIMPYRFSQPIDTTWRPFETVRDAFETLINSLQNFADFLIRFAIAGLPWLILVGLVIYGLVRLVIWLVNRAQRSTRSSSTD
ncbi:MAG: DUF4349 domain-containing protein [Anaerolineae bacterium]